MKKWLYALKLIAFSFLSVFVHLSVVSLLPHPWYAVHIALSLLMLQIISAERGSIVWMGFVIGMLFDIYSTSLFGLHSISFTFTALFLYWLYKEIFITQSLWAVALLAMTGTVLFRVIYSIISFFTTTVLWSDILVYSIVEFLSTVILTVLLYLGLGIYKHHKPLH